MGIFTGLFALLLLGLTVLFGFAAFVGLNVVLRPSERGFWRPEDTHFLCGCIVGTILCAVAFFVLVLPETKG